MRTSLTVALLAVSAFALAGTKVTVADLLKDADKHDKKVVTVVGTVEDFKAKTSKAGNDYFTFKLADGKEKINVYGRGKLEKDLKKGQKVELTGKYDKLKELKDFAVKNQLDVSGKGDEKPGVKVL